MARIGPYGGLCFQLGKSATTDISTFELLFKQQRNRPDSLLRPEDATNGDEDYKPNRPTEQQKLAKSMRKDTKNWDKVIQRTRRTIEETSNEDQ